MARSLSGEPASEGGDWEALGWRRVVGLSIKELKQSSRRRHHDHDHWIAIFLRVTAGDSDPATPKVRRPAARRVGLGARLTRSLRVSSFD